MPGPTRTVDQAAGIEVGGQLVEIEKPIYGGAFLARAEGKAIFVPLALPGEQARVRIVEEKRGYATAEIEERLTAAPERVAAPCTYFGACGGCQYQHADYEAQFGLKQAILRETLERGGVRAPEEIEVLRGEPWAYRNRIRLAFDASGKSGLSRTALARCDCDCRMPHRCSGAGEGCAGICADCAPACAGVEAEGDCAVLRCRGDCAAGQCFLREFCKGWPG